MPKPNRFQEGLFGQRHRNAAGETKPDLQAAGERPPEETGNAGISITIQENPEAGKEDTNPAMKGR